MDEDDIDADATWHATLISVGVIAGLVAGLASGPLAARILGGAVALAAIGLSRPDSDCEYGQDATPPEACVIAAPPEPAAEIQPGREVSPEMRWADSLRAGSQAGQRCR